MSHLDLGLRPPVALYKPFSSFLFLQIFEFKPNRNTVPSHRKSQISSQSGQKTQGNSAVLSAMYIMFEVAFEEINGPKYSGIIQVSSDPYDLYRFFTEMSSAFSWLLTWCSPKEMAQYHKPC